MRQWTQDRLAYELNITQSTLSDIENDKSSPTWKLILEISRVLDIPVLHLLPQNVLGIEQGQESVKNGSHDIVPVKTGDGQSFDTIAQLIQTKDELIRAKDELIQELREKNAQKKMSSFSKDGKSPSVELP